MDKDTKDAFEKVFDKLENQDVVLKTVVERLEEMGQQFVDVRSEIKRLDASVEAIPDKIDGIYGHTINDILDRLQAVEEKLGLTVRS